MLAITTAATKGYLFVWPQCLQRALAAISNHKEGVWIFSTDTSDEGQKAFELLENSLPNGWKAKKIELPIVDDSSENYKEPAQIRIAQLQGTGFAEARRIGADLCLCVESDVLIRADALRILEWAIQMPSTDGTPYYDIAMATYPNGLFLGGHGSPTSAINENFHESELKLTPKLIEQSKKFETQSLEFQKQSKQPSKDWLEKFSKFREEIKKCHPVGNIWEITAKYGWKRRGWLDFAYPAIGLGALLPTDWVGLGCTLLSKRALSVADFSGYDGRGTQDLFLCWKRWFPAGLRMCVSPHTPCDHVKPQRNDKGVHTGEYVHHQTSHEQVGEAKGHLRCNSTKFIPL